MKVDIYVVGDINNEAMIYVINNEAKKYTSYAIEEYDSIAPKEIFVLLQLLGVEYFIINGRTSTLDKIINEYTFINCNKITI